MIKAPLYFAANPQIRTQLLSAKYVKVAARCPVTSAMVIVTYVRTHSGMIWWECPACHSWHVAGRIQLGSNASLIHKMQVMHLLAT